MGKTITSSNKKNVDIHQETTKALRYIDFARARNYDLSRLFKCELSEISEFCQKVQNMIMNLSKDCQRIDIVFDIYLENSIKASARKSRKKSIGPIPMSIDRDNQQIPSAIDSFWASESNKEALRMHYIKWVIKNYSGEMPIYLGGSLSGDIFGCKKVERGNISDALNLRCEHEEADDCLMLHIDDAVRAGYEKIIIASPDTGIFVTALYHYTKWIHNSSRVMDVLW